MVTLSSLFGVALAVRPERSRQLSEATSGMRSPSVVPGDVERSHQWDAAWAGVKNEVCGQGRNGKAMKIGRVAVPWEKTNSRVENARSRDDCKKCAGDLESGGLLQSGWQCRRAWFGLNFFRWRIFRKADRAVSVGSTPIHTFNLTEADAEGKPLPLPIATAPLPNALRGIFWLADQKESSAIATFAGRLQEDAEPADGKWITTGKLSANAYRIMPAGDCHWAFATLDEPGPISGYGLARSLGVVYDFIFDSAEDPQYAHIGPNLRNGPGGWFNWGEWLKNQRWLGHFEMFLETPERAAELGFPGSVMWRRQTLWLWGQVSSSTGDYHMTQVVDEDGNRIQPAWDKFVAYQQSEIAGTSPGILHYHGNC